MANISRCEQIVKGAPCGRRRAMAATRCISCLNAHMAALRAQADAHVARGTCPDCGSELVRNLAFTTWWQCACYGEPSRRKPEHRAKPACSFQCFTSH